MALQIVCIVFLLCSVLLLLAGAVELVFVVGFTIVICAYLSYNQREGFATPQQRNWRAVSLAALFAFYYVGLFTGWLLIFGVLVIGWTLFLIRTIPSFSADVPAIAVGLSCLAAFVAGSHWFVATLYNRPAGDESSARTWQPRWTFGLAAGVALMFVCGLASYGLFQSSLEVWKLRETP